MIRPQYKDARKRKEEIEADSFEEAIQKLKEILFVSAKNSFHNFSVFFDDYWYLLEVNGNTVPDDWVFDISIKKAKFSILKIK
ncbi:MAG: hypothetical protein IB617_02520 [Candidatus Nealsonbacteria bacterium]|nr:MAG: hypothetical protein IB617_02520 [Candidatus Nealsonbacteria bacterium]